MSDSSYNQFCPVAMAAEILGARWTLVLLRELVVGSTRFNDLRRGVPRMSPALLSKRLKDLETAGIVTRSPVVGEPGAFEYRLTEAGRELKPVIEAGH
jgi:DNA-binding HxlR family transcriptional regulator